MASEAYKQAKERYKNSGKWRECSLKYLYGISLEEYQELSEEQNHVCAVCGNAETATYKGRIKNLAVDHCHQTGEIRGLLCADCNRALGLLKDNIQTIENAANYLRGAYNA